MSDAGPTIETIEEASGGGHFAITGDDADRVPYLLGLALGVARQHRTERDTWRERVDEMDDRIKDLIDENAADRLAAHTELTVTEAERDRLRAVVEAARKTVGGSIQAIEAVRTEEMGRDAILRNVLAALTKTYEQLNGSGIIGGEET